MPVYQIKRLISGTFHQGDIRFGNTAGRQCACNALFSIFWSNIRSVSRWSSPDLDKILNEGDQLYKSLNTQNYLDIDNLPSTIVTFSGHSAIILRETIECEVTLVQDFPFLSTLNQFTNPESNSSKCLFFIQGYTIAIFRVKEDNVNKYFVFDSHSRDTRGLSVHDGTSVLMKFDNLHEFEKYIQVIYLEYRGLETTYCQIQFIDIIITENQRAQLASSFSNNLRSVRRQNQNCNARKKNSSKRKQYYAKNKDEINKKRKDTYASKKDEINKKRKDTYASKKDKINKKRKDMYKQNKDKKCDDEHNRVTAFKSKIKEGPFYICVCCNRCLYALSMKKFLIEKYKFPIENYCNIVQSFDGFYYICKTCDKKLTKKKIPCQCVYNKLQISLLPDDLKNVRRLERVLISRRIIFKKVTIMPKGQAPKLKGALCNIPIETNDLVNVLPRNPDSNGIIVMKLKRKLEYRGHVYFEGVRPEFVTRLLQYLKLNNHLYEDVEINPLNIPNELINLNTEHEGATDIAENEEKVNFQIYGDPLSIEQYLINSTEPIPIITEKDDPTLSDNNESDQELETVENPLDEFRFSVDETTLMTHMPSSHEIDNEILTIAPGEGKTPISILNDEYCEELSHPHLFPTGKFGYKVKRDIKLSPVKYFNQRLLNYTQLFAADPDFIFFANSIMQQIHLTSQINIAMKKVSSDQLRAGMLSQNFKETVRQFIANDRAFSFMSTIKGTPAYWKRFLQEVLAMVKQLGPPNFFLTLSCADLRWNDLISIICKLKGQNVSDEKINSMTYLERCQLLNSNPVLVARHFQYRVENFFKEIVLNGPLGKTQYYAIRVEFQVRGSPHVHSFLWTENSPTLTNENKELYIQHVDEKISAILPGTNQNEISELVKTYQIHRHSKTCRKYRNNNCRFHFGKFFCDRTIISEPLSDFSSKEKKTLLVWREEILEKVKAYINTELNPTKKNFFDENAENYETPKSSDEILDCLNIEKEDYYKALSISDDDDFQIHLKRNPNSCFVNNYFCEGLSAWQANLDIQPVFNYYKAVTYMCAYLSKSEDECSQAMKQAAQEAYENNLDIYEKMRSISKAYVTKREVSVQEAVYLVMPELWLRKVFPGVLFANSNIPAKRFRICLSEEEITNLPVDSTEIFKRNMIDRYCARPNNSFANSAYRVIDGLCLAEFLRYYTLKYEDKDNDCQPDELADELIEINHELIGYPRIIPLMGSKEKLRCRKVPLVLRFYEPNKVKQPEDYAHHLLFLYYPFRSEDELLSQTSQSYIEKLHQPGVIDTINVNKALIEPFSELVDQAFEHFLNTDTTVPDAYSQQENAEVLDQLVNDVEGDDIDNEAQSESSNATISIISTLLTDEDINSRIRSLNSQQREVFEFALNWAREYVKNLSSKAPTEIKPFNLFLTGGGGVGKSHLLTTIYHALSKQLIYKGNEPGKTRIIVMAPTGVAAININGTTIHSGLKIPTRGKLFPLNSKSKTMLRLKLSCVDLIVIDEISMVNSKLFKEIDLRFREIFGLDIPFGGKPIIICGDLYQLPPVTGRPVYMHDSSYIQGILGLELWRTFCMAELTEVMRQRGDVQLIDLLNQARVGKLDEENVELLKSRFISKESADYPFEVIHIFAENVPVNEYNKQMLQQLDTPLIQIDAIDEFPREAQNVDLTWVKTAKLSETDGLTYKLEIKVGARIMITKNIDISDKLINGQVGTVAFVKFINNIVVAIYVTLDDVTAGLKSKQRDMMTRQNNWIVIERAEATFNTKKGFSNSPCVRRTQFPLMLAWACTCHKVQSLSIPSAVISFELLRQRQFNVGQMYVALSRVTNMDGLFLIGEYSNKAIRINKKADAEYERLRTENLFKPLKDLVIPPHSVTITLLNTRSLSKHAIDIAADMHLCNSDVICLTESQLLPDFDTFNIEENLNGFILEYNHCASHKFKSLAICYREMTLIEHVKFPGVSIITFLKSKFSPDPFTLLLIYRQPGNVQQSFYDNLTGIFEIKKIDVVLGDFNIDALGPMYVHLRVLMTNFKLVVNKPTHLSGGLLDHVYINEDFIYRKQVHCYVKSVFFSDHDAIRLNVAIS